MKSKYSNDPRIKTTTKVAVAREDLIDKINEGIAVNTPRIKPILEGNLLKFNKFVLDVEKGKDNVPLAPVHEELCKFIDKNKRKKKLCLIPRGHLKSTIVTIGYTLQTIARDPTKRILIANATYNLACSFLTDIKRQLKFNQKFHMIWGDLSQNTTNWSQNQITLSTSKKKEPTVTAMGVESNLTSQHYDLIILDDVVNKDFVNTQDQIQKTISFYKECLNLLEPGGEVVIVGTRWHDSDLYGWILDHDNNILSDFEVFIKQAYEGTLDKDGEFKALFPDKFSRNHLKKLYDQQGPYIFCTPQDTPILMSDFTQKKISEVKVGDEVVGFTRGIPEKRGGLVRSKVKAISKHEDYVCDLKMESGRKVACTKNHKWYTKRDDDTHRLYKPARVGSRLMLVDDLDENISKREENLWFYLAGFFDADGSAKAGAKISFCQSLKVNKPVYDRLIDVIKELGLDYGEYYRDEHQTMIVWLNDSKRAAKKMIRYGDPAKKSQIIEKLYERNSRYVLDKDKVEWIKRRSKKETVYGLETETGNYIAWGYASANSTQYMNDPIPAEDADFRRDWFKYYEPTQVNGRLLNKFITIDPAISTEKNADYTAIVTIGVDEFGIIYILDIVRERIQPFELNERIFELWKTYQPIQIGIEDIAFQKSLQYSLTQEMHERSIYLPLKPLRPAGRAKDQRIRGLQPLYANGRILHNKEVKNMQHLEDELLRFPRGKHDDVIDALAYILDIPVFSPRRKKTRPSNHKYLY